MNNVQVWSCGGGTQSGAIAALIANGKLPRPDFAFMTDTGRERSTTWPFVHQFIMPQLERVGLELEIVPASDFASIDIFVDQTILLPGFTTQSGSIGKLRPFCSGKWKRDVAERWMRSKGIKTCVNWIGISLDEPTRIRAKHRGWIDLRYPLIFDVPIRRSQCIGIIRNEGWTRKIPQSSCWCCSNHADTEWQDMQHHSPEDFAAACDLESEARIRDPHFYLHPSCVPLTQVRFDDQCSMFVERGCTEGCFT